MPIFPTLPEPRDDINKHFARVGDLTIHYDLADYTDPWRTDERETFLLYPGYCRTIEFWRAWVPLLARDYRLLRMDARGYRVQAVLHRRSYAAPAESEGVHAAGRRQQMQRAPQAAHGGVRGNLPRAKLVELEGYDYGIHFLAPDAVVAAVRKFLLENK